MAMGFMAGGTRMRADDGSIHTIAATQQNLSSNGSTVYTLIEWSNGDLSCNCPGWAMKKACKHTKAVQRNGGFLPRQPAAQPISVAQTQAATAAQPSGRRVVHVKS